MDFKMTLKAVGYLKDVLTLAQNGFDIVEARGQPEMAQGCLMLLGFIERTAGRRHQAAQRC